MIKIKDPQLKLKHIAYFISTLPTDTPTFDQYVKHCKFSLCILNKMLMKDPIWDLYTNEEILIEYYSHLFAKDKDAVSAFEMSIAGEEMLDFSDWADRQMKKNKEEMENTLGNMEDSVSFSPDDVIGGS